VTDVTASALADALRDRYVLDKELGRGGMATVYLANDLKHDRYVALKVLRPELAAALGADRFLREIQLTASLQHPHILPLLDSGTAADQCYYVMPYVEGESLRERLRRDGQLPLEEALQLTREVADALDYAHERDIVHRDIKPENILLSRGHALVADFGIALAASHVGGGRLTETGLSLGTPAYMSPEQAMAEPRIDGRSDQYSLACVLYEVLAGEPPYTGPTAQAIIAKRLSEPVPHLGIVRQVPKAVEAGVTRALAKSPADRFSTTAAFAGALSRPDSAAPPANTARARWIRRLVTAGGAGLVVIGLVITGFGSRAWSRPDVGVPSHRQFTFTANAEDPAVSPDGRSIAYVVDHRSLVFEELAGGGPVFLVPAAPWLASPRWSPDGRWLYFSMLPDGVSSAATYRLPRRGGTPVKVADAVGPVDLSPDSRLLVRAIGDTLTLYDAATGAMRGRFPAHPMEASTWDLIGPRHVAWSPDGRWIASDWFDAAALEGLGRGIVTVTSADGRRSNVLGSGHGPVHWDPTGKRLYYLSPVPGGTDLVRLSFNPETGLAEGGPQVALSGLPYPFGINPPDMVFDLDHSGHTLAYVGGPQSHHVWALTIVPGHDTAVGRRLSEDSRAYDWPAITRDGATLAVVQYDEHLQGNFFTVPMTGGRFTPLTEGPGYKSNASWAPDGSRFVYVLADTSGSQLVLTDRSGQRLRIGTTSPSSVGYFRTSWSLDGRTVIYLADRGRTIVSLEVSRGTETITQPPDSIGHWVGVALSPDGREMIAAESHGLEQPFHLWHGTVGHAAWSQVSAPVGSNIPLLWRGDSWIYLFNDPRNATELPAIWRIRPDGSRPELVARLPVQCRTGFVSMSADARRLACAVHRREPDLWLVSNFGGGR
jgi:serine/threonine protein kinase/dipeptidyl aminopeptidase/acylaminoacyl peptidase